MNLFLQVYTNRTVTPDDDISTYPAIIRDISARVIDSSVTAVVGNPVLGSLNGSYYKFFFKVFFIVLCN
jgi:hypothetical protein